MKAVGIVRRIDNLGRIVLPQELRTIYNISIKDPMEIYVDADSIILKKYEPTCIFCGETKGMQYFKGKNICEKCLDMIKQK